MGKTMSTQCGYMGSNQFRKDDIWVKHISYDGETHYLVDSAGEQYTMPLDILRARYGGFKLDNNRYIAFVTEVYSRKYRIADTVYLVDCRITSKGILPRRHTEKEQRELDLWHKVELYNLRADLAGLNKCIIKRGKVTQPIPDEHPDGSITQSKLVARPADWTVEERVNIPEGFIKIPDNWESLPMAFYNKDAKVPVILPQNITKIPNGYFRSCSITGVQFGPRVKYIGVCAFRGCSNLAEIELPKSLRYLGKAAFLDCGNLKKVKINPGISQLNRDVFRGCTKLSYLYIPKSVKSIGDIFGIRSNCSDLTIDIPRELVYQFKLENKFSMPSINLRLY